MRSWNGEQSLQDSFLISKESLTYNIISVPSVQHNDSVFVCIATRSPHSSGTPVQGPSSELIVASAQSSSQTVHSSLSKLWGFLMAVQKLSAKSSLYRTHGFRRFWKERKEGEREEGSSKFLTLPATARLLVVMKLNCCFKILIPG